MTIAPPETFFEYNPKNARTDSEGLRFYRWKGEEYPSVTTIRRVAGMSHKLNQWAITQVVNRAVDNIDDLNRMITSDDPAVINAAKTWLRRGATDARDRAAAKGTRIHLAATQGKALGDVPDDIRSYLGHYYDWLDESGATILTAERQIWNLSRGYAGSFDLLLRQKDGKVALCDIKTGGGTYPEHALQLAAYSMGEFVGEDDVIDNEATELLLDVEVMALLHLTEKGWMWEVVRVDKALTTAFLGLLAFAKWNHANPDIASLMADYEEGGA